MKSIVIGFLGLLLLIISSSSCADSAYQIEFQDAKYDIFRVKPQEHSVRFLWKDSRGKNYGNFAAVKQNFADKDKTLIFATNGGIFTSNHAPLGLYIENGVVLHGLNTNKGSGNFFLMPNGVFYAVDRQFGIAATAQFANTPVNVSYATQSGPMLVIDDRINTKFNKNSNSFFIRSGVGIDQSGNAVFAISHIPVSFYSFAFLFKEQLHCPNALYLDGAISKMYLPKLAREELGGDFAVIIAIGD